MHIKKDDMVQVIAGKEKGRTGKVLRVDRQRNRIYVDGLNIQKRHQREAPGVEESGIVEKEGPIHASNVLLYSEQLGRGVRVGYRYVGADDQYFATKKEAAATLGDGERVNKVRFCARTGEVF